MLRFINLYLFLVLRDDFRLQPADTRSAAGDTALLECAPPRGTPDPIVAWKKNGQLLELEDNDRYVNTYICLLVFKNKFCVMIIHFFI